MSSEREKEPERKKVIQVRSELIRRSLPQEEFVEPFKIRFEDYSWIISRDYRWEDAFYRWDATSSYKSGYSPDRRLDLLAPYFYVAPSDKATINCDRKHPGSRVQARSDWAKPAQNFFFFLKNILSSKLGWWEDDRGRSKGDQKAIGEWSKANRRCSKGDQKKQKNRTIIFYNQLALDKHNGTGRKTKLASGRNTRGRRSLRDHNRACGRNIGKKNS